MAGGLAGKFIVPTGCGSEIVRECAHACVREGARVAIVDRDLDATHRTAVELRDDSIALEADVYDGGMVRIGFSTVFHCLGRIDAVHHDVGISSPSKARHETTEHEWDDLQRANVKPVYWTTRFVFKALNASQGCMAARSGPYAAISGRG